MPKKQIRIVLHDADYPLAEKIRQATGVMTLSDVFSLMVNRYGNSFLDWWMSNPHPQSSQGFHDNE